MAICRLHFWDLGSPFRTQWRIFIRHSRSLSHSVPTVLDRYVMKPPLLLSEKACLLRDHGLDRTKMKDVVRGWNAVPPPSKPASTSRERDHSPMDPNWAHTQTEDRNSVSRNESNSENACLESEEGGDGSTPVTVGQIQHVYRARARREDERVAAKFAEIDRQSRKDHLKKPTVRHPSQPKPAAVAAPELSTTACTVTEPRLVGAHNRFRNLSVQRMSSDPVYCEELLALIRAELFAGRDVCLHIDYASTGESMGDARLMLQHLCTRSLLFCTRDQDVLPQLVAPHALQLVLLPRRQHQL